MEVALKLSNYPTISQAEFLQDYMTLEESSARMNAIIQQHFHPTA